MVLTIILNLCSCKVFFEDQQFRTKTIDCTLNPIWNEEFICNVRSTSSTLQIEVWDYDMASADDFMGWFEINLQELVNQGGFLEAWTDLAAHPTKQEKEKAKKKKKNRGRIHLSMRLFQYHGMTKYLFENNLSAAIAVVHQVPKDQTAEALANIFYAAGTKQLVDLVSFTVLQEVNKTSAFHFILGFHSSAWFTRPLSLPSSTRNSPSWR